LSEDASFIGYYLKGKLLALKNDWKSAIINFNNASLIKEEEIKVASAKAICFFNMGSMKKM
jgi:hypothetical protein